MICEILLLIFSVLIRTQEPGMQKKRCRSGLESIFNDKGERTRYMKPPRDDVGTLQDAYGDQPPIQGFVQNDDVHGTDQVRQGAFRMR